MKDINSQNDDSINNDLDLSVLNNVSKSIQNTNDLQARILSVTSHMQQELDTLVPNSVTSKLVSVVSMFNAKQVASFVVAASVLMAVVLWVPKVISPADSGLEPIAQNEKVSSEEFLLEDLELALLSEDDSFFE